MTKLTKKLQSDEFELLQYKLDLLDRRLDKLEQIAHTKAGNSVNTELLQMIMMLMRQQIPVQETQIAPKQQQSVSEQQPMTVPGQVPISNGDLMDAFARKRTMGL
jgi:hypothetical protein